MHKQFILCSLIAILLSGCMEDLDLGHLQPEPKLVLNSVATAGLPVMAVVSRTHFIADTHDNMLIADAEVRLTVNGKELGEMAWMPLEEDNEENNLKGVYLSPYQPETSDRITVRVKAAGFPDAEATTYIPVPATIDTIRWERKEDVGYTYVYTGDSLYMEKYPIYYNTYKVSFRDEPNETNYYYISFEEGYPLPTEDGTGFSGKYSWIYRTLKYSDDPLFSAEISALDRIFYNSWLTGYGRVFDDRLIDGKEYTLHLEDDRYWSGFFNFYEYRYPDFSLSDVPEEERLPVLGRFSLYTLSDSFYSYIKSVTELHEDRLINDLIRAGLAEPLRVYNNISGGVGILGGCTPYSKTTVLHTLETVVELQ